MVSKIRRHVLKEIGLSENYAEMQGEESYTLVKEKALKKLPVVIGKLSEADKCSKMNPSSLKLLEIVSGIEDENSVELFHDTVTKLVDAHVELAGASEEEQRKHFAALHSDLVAKNIGFREAKKK
jgi:hypothetical protein